MCCAARGDAGEVVRKEAIARAAGGFYDIGVVAIDVSLWWRVPMQGEMVSLPGRWVARQDLCDTVGVTQFYGMDEKFTFRRWGACCQMKVGAVFVSFAFLALSGFAWQRVVVPSLPEAVRPMAEVESNVVFSIGSATDNKWTLTIERDAATSNSVEVVLGRDTNEDGALGIEEGELSVGWDCGEWFWRDRRANAACRVEGTAQRLEMTLYLRDRAAKSLASSVFPSVVSPTCFNPDWNFVCVVSRGAEAIYVESKISIDALKLRIR